MQSAEDRRRLMEQYSERPSRPLVAVLKCAAGMATLVAVAAGPWIVLSSGGFGVTTDSRQQTAAEAPRSTAESRRVFEKRRHRFEGDRENTKAALAK